MACGPLEPQQGVAHDSGLALARADHKATFSFIGMRSKTTYIWKTKVRTKQASFMRTFSMLDQSVGLKKCLLGSGIISWVLE